MTAVQQQMDTFKTLSFAERQDIVLGMLKELKETNENFRYIYETLPILQPNEKLINDLYEDLTTLAEEKKAAIKDLEANKISKMSDYIKKIQELEAQDRAKENPEDLLDTL